jgi:hypothetical protein
MGTKISTGYDDVDEYMDVVPKGEYLARLIEVEESESSKGNPMLVWDFELLDGYPGATVRGWTSLLEHALGDARKYFRAFGKTWKAGDDLERIARRFIKKAKVKLVVGIRVSRDRDTGEERENNKINAIYAAGKAGATAAAKKASKKSEPEQEEDDDIPF